MRIAICDDEKRFIKDFSAIVDRFYKSLDMVVDEYLNGLDLLKGFSRFKYDIVFLDIEMPGIDGITTAKKIREINENVYIVFLTGHVEYAIKGYEVNALRYLTKPATEESIHEILKHVLDKQNKDKFLWVKNKDVEKKIKYSDIVYIEAQDKNVVIYTPSESTEIRGRLNDYEDLMQADGFFRVHRSYMVSLSKIMSITGSEITVAGGYRILLSKAKEKEFREAFMSFIHKEAF